MTCRRNLLAVSAGLLLLLAPLTAPNGAEPIKIGDLNSYTRLPAFSLPYKKGWQLALDRKSVV